MRLNDYVALLLAVAAMSGVSRAHGAPLQVFAETGVANTTSYGLDVLSTQSVAVRFTPRESGAVQRLDLWLMANAPATSGTVDLRATSPQGNYPASHSLPGGEPAAFETKAQGWDPTLQQVAAPGWRVQAGGEYWVVVQSEAAAGANPVWLVAPALAWVAVSQGSKEGWKNIDSTSGAPGMTVWGQPSEHAEKLIELGGPSKHWTTRKMLHA